MSRIAFGKRIWALFAIVCVLWFVNIRSGILTEPDEGRYAEIPREMLASGDWLTPRLDGITYFEKPPLQYWITAAAYRIFGEQPWVSRLWTWTASFACVAAILLAGAALFEIQAGIVGALILASSPLFFFVGHINTLDAGLTLFMTLALCGFLLSKRSAEGPARRWMILSWIATAFAVLSKGPVAIAIPALSALAYGLTERRSTVFHGTTPWLGIAGFAVIAVPWFVLVSLRNPDFASFFFIHEHVARFTTTEHGRSEPWWFFLAILGSGILPWMIPALGGWQSALRQKSDGAFDARRFLAIYGLVVLVFFSASGSKLAPYVDPAVPALSLLAASWFGRKNLATEELWLLFPAFSAILLIAVVPYLQWRMHDTAEAGASLRFSVWLFGTALVWIVGFAIAFALRRRSNGLAPIVAVALALIGGMQLIVSGLSTFASTRSGLDVAQALEDQDVGNRPIYSVNRYLQTVTFYLKRTVIVVGYPGELEVSLDPQTRNWIPGLGGFASQWGTEKQPIAIIDRDIWPEVQRLGLPMQVFFSDSRVILVKKPIAPDAAARRTAS